MITFPNFDGENDWYTFVYTASDFEGEIRESDEGSLHWIEDDRLCSLNLWEGDPYFLEWIYNKEYKDRTFSSKFIYVDKKYIAHEVSFNGGENL